MKVVHCVHGYETQMVRRYDVKDRVFWITKWSANILCENEAEARLFGIMTDGNPAEDEDTACPPELEDIFAAFVPWLNSENADAEEIFEDVVSWF
jgi:hypothetical protein